MIVNAFTVSAAQKDTQAPVNGVSSVNCAKVARSITDAHAALIPVTLVSAIVIN